MNRKLLNGLLVLAVATGGVGTFTSCKDDDFRNDVLFTESILQAQINAIKGVSDADFQLALEEWLNNWTENIKNSGFEDYPQMVQATTAMYDIYTAILSDKLTPAASQYVDKLYNWMFNNEIQASDWYDLIFTLANKRATSVAVNRTYNPVFGSIDLPIGLHTTVLGTYIVDSDKPLGYTFPTDLVDVDYLAIAKTDAYADALNVIAGLNPVNALKIEKGAYTDGGKYGNMGAAYVNINPSSINFAEGNYTVKLINTVGETALSSEDVAVEGEGDDNEGAVMALELMVNDDVLKFGYTRADDEEEGETSTAATGIYRLNANAYADANIETFDLNDGVDFLSDVADAIKDRTISNIAYIGEQLYKKLNNRLEAYAVEVSWEENVVDQTTGVATGTQTNSVLSNFDVAAAVIHPLSYGTDINSALGSSVTSKRLPTFSPLRDYLTRIQNKITVDFTEIDGIDYIKSLDLNVKLENGKIVFTYVNNEGKTVSGYFDYDLGQINATEAQLSAFVSDLFAALDQELTGAINSQVITDLNNSIENINKQLKDYSAKMDDFNQSIDRIKNSSKFDYAEKLVDAWNRLAEKLNNIIADPNHYLQVAAIYSDGEGHYHHLSTAMDDPTIVSPADGGDSFEILASSYTGDVVVPSYQKYLAITKLNNADATAADNTKAGEMLNTVYPGDTMRFPVKVNGFNSGDVLQLTYVSVDYHGMCSMQNYYVKVK
ncbi:MAG: hypothetical protein J1F16_02140 [Muribaculaceae bacterium]|nr:hypothetical protein [Muribaculaceae bacterium]